MKTIDVRLLVADEVTPEVLAKQLVTLTGGPGAPLGSVRLNGDRYGRLALDAQVWTRDGVPWAGEPLGEGTHLRGPQVSAR